MDVVRGSLREFGMLLNVMTGDGVPDGDGGDRRRPRRGPAWIVVQVAALAVLAAVLFGVADLFVDTRETGSAAAWVLPGFVLMLPLAMHWFARPDRRVAGLLAGVAAGVLAGAASAPVVAGWVGIWPGLATVTLAVLVAGAVFGAVAPVPAAD